MTVVTFTYIAKGIDEISLHSSVQSLLERESDWRIIKENHRNIIAYQDYGRLYFKSFNNNRLKESLKRATGGSRAWRTLKATKSLTKAGCLAPQVIACGHYEACDFVLMEALTGPQLMNAIHSYLQSSETSRWRKTLFRTLGLAVGQLHSSGLVHGDLRPNNVIIHPSKEGYQIGFIDNERTRKPIRFKREQKRNLRQIMLLGDRYITKAERISFFAAYFSRMSYKNAVRRSLYRQTLADVAALFEQRPPGQGTQAPEELWWLLKDLSPAPVPRRK